MISGAGFYYSQEQEKNGYGRILVCKGIILIRKLLDGMYGKNL
jgi:hypothetical protein